MRPCTAQPTRSSPSAPECAVCAFQLPAHAVWRCDACEMVLCCDCLPSAPLQQLNGEERAVLATSTSSAATSSTASSFTATPPSATTAPCSSTLAGDGVVSAGEGVAGSWPCVDEHGRVTIWFCWTGDNALPAYLGLCIRTFELRAARRFRVRVVRPADVHTLLDGDVHPAYDDLSLVHRADYLRCELLHKYGGFYCDADTICRSDLSRPLEALAAGSTAVLGGSHLLLEAGMNAGLFRRNSLLTHRWRQALRARLDRRAGALREFRAQNADVREDALEWNEVLRDIIVPLIHAAHRLHPAGTVVHTLDAYHWTPEAQQGFDPLLILPSADAPPDAEPEELPAATDVVVLTNNQYSGRIKSMTRDEFLRSGCLLARWVQSSASIHG